MFTPEEHSPVTKGLGSGGAGLRRIWRSPHPHRLHACLVSGERAVPTFRAKQVAVAGDVTVGDTIVLGRQREKERAVWVWLCLKPQPAFS